MFFCEIFKPKIDINLKSLDETTRPKPKFPLVQILELNLLYLSGFSNNHLLGSMFCRVFSQQLKISSFGQYDFQTHLEQFVHLRKHDIKYL